MRDADAKVVSASPLRNPSPGQRFPRSCRLTARRQFVYVYDKGRKTRRRSFMVFAHPSDVDVTRLGLTVTKRTGNSVVRNRIKRKLRDAFRRRRMELPGGLDLVINARRSVLDSSAEELERDLVDAVTELHRNIAR